MTVSWTWILAIALMTSTSGCAFPVSHDQTHRETISLSCRPDERLHRGDALASDCTKVIQSPDATVEEQALAYFYRGTVRLEAGQPGVALMDLDQAIRLNPNTQRVFLARCEAYLAIGQPDLAIRDCDRSLQRTPVWEEALDYRGKAYAAKGQLVRAIRDFSEAIRLNPNMGAYYQDRGLAYQALGQREKARADLATAKRRPPRPIL